MEGIQNKMISFETSDSDLLKALKLSLNNTILKLNRTWNLTLFTMCFPSLASKKQKSLEAIISKIRNLMTQSLCSDLAEVIHEELAKPLNELSVVIQSNTSSSLQSRVWRPSSFPVKDQEAHDIMILKREKQKLVEALDKVKKNRLEMFDLVKAGRNKCHKRHCEIQKTMNISSDTVKLLQNADPLN